MGRDATLIRLAKILKNLSKKIKREIRFSVYSVQAPQVKLLRRFKSVGIDYCGSLQSHELARRLTQADFLIHAESFERRYVELTRLSISTKLPEYLSSGTCLLACGPAELASIRLVKDNCLGVTVTDLEDEAHALGELEFALTSLKRRGEFVTRAKIYAAEKFNAKRVSGEFYKLVSIGNPC